jgi:hypothetical protein
VTREIAERQYMKIPSLFADKGRNLSGGFGAGGISIDRRGNHCTTIGTRFFS